MSFACHTTNRVVAAQLEREDLVRCLGELAVKRHSGAGRSGEQQAVDAGFAGQRAALVGPADEQPHDALRESPAAWKHSTRKAPLAGVFSDGLNTTALPAISAGTMWPLGRCAGKLYGPSTASTPCGLWRTATLLPSAASSFRCRGALRISVDRNFDLVDDRADFGPRFPERLAGFARDECRRNPVRGRGRRWRNGAGPRSGR